MYTIQLFLKDKKSYEIKDNLNIDILSKKDLKEQIYSIIWKNDYKDISFDGLIFYVNGSQIYERKVREPYTLLKDSELTLNFPRKLNSLNFITSEDL